MSRAIRSVAVEVAANGPYEMVSCSPPAMSRLARTIMAPSQLDSVAFGRQLSMARASIRTWATPANQKREKKIATNQQPTKESCVRLHGDGDPRTMQTQGSQ